jgi:hypothetical protein
MDYIEKDKQQHQDKDGNGFWNFKHIVGHEGPFRTSDPEYKGSRYNILVEWENGRSHLNLSISLARMIQ